MTDQSELEKIAQEFINLVEDKTTPGTTQKARHYFEHLPKEQQDYIRKEHNYILNVLRCRSL